ncbi:MAG: hypothetical protein LBR90_03985, partial [Elusimicrobiota bacterium]|nr:hypothetical protein [Elusimicrobiota bacterium]
MFKHLKITFIVFVLLPCAGILAAQSLNIPPGMGAGPIDYSEYYVNPQEERQPAGGAPAQEGDITSHGPWMICEIKTRGLVNINKKTITKNISARESRLYENYQIQDDVNSLMALGNFDNVEMDISLSPGARRDKSDAQDKTLHPCHVLTAIVTEKPIFEAITYQGRKKLSKNAIQTAMSLKLKDPFNLAKLTSDMERINEAYAQKGYINAKAAFVTEEDPDKNIVTAVITIDEGQRVRVGEVNVEGLQALPLKKFLKQLSNRPGKVYRAQKLPEDHYKATIYARNEGYYDFKITDFTNPESEDKSLINLNYSVHEGHRVKFGDTAYSGNAVYSDEELD